jgi:predicted nucleic acid-binding protein
MILLCLAEKKEMQGKSFIDTNIIVYQFLEPIKLSDRPKHLTAIEILQNPELVCISTQALNELSNVLLKRYALKKEIVIGFLQELVSDTEVVRIEPIHIFNAIEISTKYKFSFYDCLIVATALSADCSTLITEDLQNQQVISYQDRQIQIINPFQELAL